MMPFKLLSHPLWGFYVVLQWDCTQSCLCFAVLNMCFAEGQELKAITAVPASDEEWETSLTLINIKTKHGRIREV